MLLDQGDCKVSSSSSSSSSNTVEQPSSSIERMVLSRELLHEMSIRELRSILEAFSINTMECVDKYDLIELLENCQFVNVVD